VNLHRYLLLLSGSCVGRANSQMHEIRPRIPPVTHASARPGYSRFLVRTWGSLVHAWVTLTEQIRVFLEIARKIRHTKLSNPKRFKYLSGSQVIQSKIHPIIQPFLKIPSIWFQFFSEIFNVIFIFHFHSWKIFRSSKNSNLLFEFCKKKSTRVHLCAIKIWFPTFRWKILISPDSNFFQLSQFTHSLTGWR